MANRTTLAVSHLAALRSWAKLKGWTEQPLKGEWEVLRLRHKDRKHPAIFYDRLGGKFGEGDMHLSVFGESERLAAIFLASRKRRGN